MKKYLLIIFIILAILALILLTKQREKFGPFDLFHPAAPPPDYQGEINHLQGEVDGLTQRVVTLEQEEQKAQDQTNQAIGGIQMVSKS